MTDEKTEGAAAEGGRIIVGVDGSAPSKVALRWAVRQATLTRSELVVVTAWDYPTSFGWAPPWPRDFDPESNAREALDRTLAEVVGDSPPIEISTVLVQGHPSPVLTDLSKTASLLVVGSRGHGEFAGMLLGSVSEFLTAHAHCDVVVVRPE